MTNHKRKKELCLTFISRVTAPVFLTFLCLVVVMVATVRAQVLDFTVEVDQDGAGITVRANNATTRHWMEEDDSHSPDVLTVAGAISQGDPPDDKPPKPCCIRFSDILIGPVSWLPQYALEMVVGYRLLLSVQDDSLSVKGLSWWPVVATIVLGQLVYTWWHAETPLFNQWEEQQQHLAGLNIITCMDHPPPQSSYPQRGSGSGTSNPWTWGSQGNYFPVYGGYGPPGGGDGGHDPQIEHTFNHQYCLLCGQRPCLHATASNRYGDVQSGFSMTSFSMTGFSTTGFSTTGFSTTGFSTNSAVVLSHTSPESGVPTNPGAGTLFENQETITTVTPPQTAVLTQQEPQGHGPGCICVQCFNPSLDDYVVPTGAQSTAVSWPASVQPPASDWPLDHDPDNPYCYCIRCKNIYMGYDTAAEGQSIDYVERGTSVGDSNMSERPVSVFSSYARKTTESAVHQQFGSIEGLEPGVGLGKFSPRKLYSCPKPGCMKVYLTRQRLKGHIDAHDQKQNCPFCRKTFQNKEGFKYHINMHQNNYPCRLCGKSLASKSILRDHMTRPHCSKPGCDRFFTTDEDLRQHLRDHKEALPCPTCKQIFWSSLKLVEHTRKCHPQHDDDDPCEADTTPE